MVGRRNDDPIAVKTFGQTLVGAFAGIAIALNVLVIFGLMCPFVPLKLVFPTGPVRRFADRILNALANHWIGINGVILAMVGHTRWDVTGLGHLKRRGWYLVSSNHQSWTDILVLQKVFHNRIPFLKFFLKEELKWVPVIGLAWWALDFPFMQRGKKGGRGDLETTRRACEKFKLIPTSVMNFCEGTRFTKAKHAAQQSPYRRLLKPRAGGMAVALATMGAYFEALLDVTIVYPQGVPTFWDLLCGRMREVIVRVEARPIPVELIDTGKRPSVAKSRRGLEVWLDELWREKDLELDEILAAQGSAGARRSD